MRKKKIKYALYLKGRKEPFMFFERKEDVERFLNRNNPIWEVKEVEK